MTDDGKAVENAEGAGRDGKEVHGRNRFAMILQEDQPTFSSISRAIHSMLKAMVSKPTRTAYRSPWQNDIAERWVGSCRRELLDHVIVFNEAHLRRLVREYLSYYHNDRTHDGLSKDAPSQRPVQPPNAGTSRVVTMLRVGGLNHRYAWREAA